MASLTPAAFPTLNNFYVQNESFQSRTISGFNQTDVLYFKDCKQGNYVVTGVSKKVMVENCQNTKIHLQSACLTGLMDVLRSQDLKITIDNDMPTVQVDLSTNVTFHFAAAEGFHTLIWTRSEDIEVDFGDYVHGPSPTGRLKTGLSLLPDSELPPPVVPIDGQEQAEPNHQFTIRFVNDVLKVERVVRSGGYTSTERENKEYEKRQEENTRKLVQALLGNERQQTIEE